MVQGSAHRIEATPVGPALVELPPPDKIEQNRGSIAMNGVLQPNLL
jgi:hypothetical protein